MESGGELFQDPVHTTKFEEMPSLFQKLSQGSKFYARLVDLIQNVSPYVVDIAINCA